MEKIGLWSLVAGVVVLSGCGVLPQEEKVLSGDISQTGNETELFPAEALSGKEAKLTLAEVQAQTGDTTPIVVITEANSGAIVTQTGDSLIYRNEVYGFQVKFGKETKGSKLFVNGDRNGNNDQPTFLLYGKEEAGELQDDNNPLGISGFVEILGVKILNSQQYQDAYSGAISDIGGREGFLSEVLGFNEKYFFQSIVTNVGHEMVAKRLPNLVGTSYQRTESFEEKDCGNRPDRILYKDFVVFNI
ncbi:MAG: hypothetical protein HG424_002510 [candidate division SR1 bacterium]|nr:hypothetical protein [candidate division SR1 bacterium]